MTPLPIAAVLGTLATAAAFAVIFDFVKVPAFRRLGISWRPAISAVEICRHSFT
jgi:hypothetical protein